MPGGEPRGEVAAALDELGDPAAAELADRRVDREPAGAAGELRRPVQLVARAALVGVDQVVGVDGGRAAVRLRAGAEHDPAVVGNVQPFVPVGRPRVRPLGAVDQVREARARRRPQPKAPSTCSQAPAASAASAIAWKSVERAGVHLAGLRADDRRAVVRRRAPRGARPGASALVVGRDPLDRARAEADEASARGKVECAFSPAKTRIGGAPVRPFSSTSQPTSASTWLRAAAIAVACAIWVPVTNANDCARGMPQEVDEPLAGDLLGDRAPQGRRRTGRVLVPGRGQPVGGQRRRDGTADDEAEVARRPGSRPPPRCPPRRVGDDLARRRSGRQEPGRRAGRGDRRRRPSGRPGARGGSRGSRRRGRPSRGATRA